MENKNLNPYLVNMVMMFASVSWQHLGKVPNPITNKSEVDLKSAQFVIDTLIMIKEKTDGNLTDEETKMIDNTISDLQINYADEVAKQEIEKKPEVN